MCDGTQKLGPKVQLAALVLHLSHESPLRSSGYLPAFERFRDDVVPGCDGLTTNDLRRLRLRGIELRYTLTMHLFDHGPATITDLVEALASQGFDGGKPAPKSVSDALRWELRRGRVRRLGRGRDGPGRMPRVACQQHGTTSQPVLP
jgi:hypothetical protein